MTYKDYLKQIIAFNGDKDIISLREKFNQASFFEIISKERSETTYSAFLKWLFQENSLNKVISSPLSLLLDVLVRRCEEQEGYVDSILCNAPIKRSIVTRNLTIQPVIVETEKSVSSLAQNITYPSKCGVISYSDLSKIAAKSKDKIDLFLECEIESDDKDITANRIQIIIENKIDSGEGNIKKDYKTGLAAYDDATQTKRYYIGTKFSSYDLATKQAIDGQEVIQIYVYLTPTEPQKDSCEDSHFVQISYQDIVDGILTPMLSSSSLSERSRFFVEEFLNQLVFPSLDGTRMHPSIAIGEHYSEELTKIWNKYQPLLSDAAIAASETNLWKIGGTYYDHQPREELLNLLLEKGIQCSYIVDGKWKERTQYSKMTELSATAGISTEMVKLSLDDTTQELLSAFWDKNKRFFTAILNGMKPKERSKYAALLTQLSKRDTTKYSVYYEDTQIGNNLGKSQTAYCIIKKWVELQKNEGKTVTLDILRNTFPISYNPYYAHGKWFQHMFYEVVNTFEYDGTEAEGPVQGNWDFDKKGNYNIETTDDKIVTMLKMWRKDALEYFIEEIKKHQLFKGTLDVVPAE